MRVLPLILLASCVAVPPLPPPPVFPTLEIMVGGNRASATHLGGGTWITNRHVLGELATTAILGHQHVKVFRDVEGVGQQPSHDWVTFSTSPVVAFSSLPVDLDAPIAPGEHVWVTGYGHPGRDVAHQGNLIAATVDESDVRERLLSLRFPDDRVHPGLSGAAVVHHNTVVGIIVGRQVVDGQATQLAVRPRER